MPIQGEMKTVGPMQYIYDGDVWLLVTKSPDYEILVAEVIQFISDFGCTDGDHHKQWALDQILRILLGDSYKAWREVYEQDGEYEWDEGIAP